MAKIIFSLWLCTMLILTLEFSVDAAPTIFSGKNHTQVLVKAKNHKNAARDINSSTSSYRLLAVSSKARLSNVNQWDDNEICSRCFFSCSWCHRLQVSLSHFSSSGFANIQSVNNVIHSHLDPDDYSDPEYHYYDYENEFIDYYPDTNEDFDSQLTINEYNHDYSYNSFDSNYYEWDYEGDSMHGIGEDFLDYSDPGTSDFEEWNQIDFTSSSSFDGFSDYENYY